MDMDSTASKFMVTAGIVDNVFLMSCCSEMVVWTEGRGGLCGVRSARIEKMSLEMESAKIRMVADLDKN